MHPTIRKLTKARNFTELQKKLRESNPHSLDILSLLKQAYKDKHLILTLPWILEYLRQVDSCAIHLKAFKEVYALLLLICDNLTKDMISSKVNSLYLVICMALYMKKYIGNNSLSEVIRMKVSEFTRIELSSDKYEAPIDELPLMNYDFIYKNTKLSTIQRYLNHEMRITSEYRKITPVSLSSVDNLTNETYKTKLLKSFEENFFNLHPTSHKKIVEFISEKVSSNCIELIKNQLSENAVQQDDLTVENLREKYAQFSESFCKENMDKISSVFFNEKNLGKKVQEVSKEISIRWSLEKIHSWLHKNLNENLIKESKKHERKCTLQDLDSQLLTETSKIFEKVRDIITNLYSNEKEFHFDEKDSIKLIDQFQKIRQKTLPNKIKILLDVSFNDIFFCLIAKNPSLISKDYIDKLVLYYKNIDINPEDLLSSRNLYILQRSSDMSRQKFSRIIFLMIDSSIINLPQGVEKQTFCEMLKHEPMKIKKFENF